MKATVKYHFLMANLTNLSLWIFILFYRNDSKTIAVYSFTR